MLVVECGGGVGMWWRCEDVVEIAMGASQVLESVGKVSLVMMSDHKPKEAKYEVTL